MKDKDFISEVKETLGAWQEPYDNGAWEDFYVERRRRNDVIVAWRYAGIAASLLLLFGWLWFMGDGTQQAEPHYVKHMPMGKPFMRHDAVPFINAEPDTARDAIAGNNTSAPATQIHFQNSHNTSALTASHLSKNTYTDNTKQTEIAKVNSTNKGSAFNNDNVQNTNVSDSSRVDKKQHNQSILADASPKKIQSDSHPIYDSLAKRQKQNIKKVANNSLLYAVAIHPAVGNKKVSIGAGLEIAYPFTEHLSVGSGLSFASLHAETAPGKENGFKQLQSTDLDVTGIELPLTLSYRVKNGFYLNAGISAVAVLSNQLSNNYIIQSTQTVTQLTAGGVAQQTLQVTSNKSTEQSAEQLSHYIGFYTFTIGKKQAVGKNQVDFGPFLKVPFNPVSSQNVRFTQGGFRLSFGF